MPARLDILSTTQDESFVQDSFEKKGEISPGETNGQACGKTVVDLERLTMGPLKLVERPRVRRADP